jgi:dienelactone hydrolase
MGGHHLSHGPANRGRRVLQTAAPLFVCRPEAPPKGGVIVLHDVHGMTEPIERACRLLALDGWLAVSPYLYYQRGGPAFPDTGPETVPEAARAEMAGLSPDDVAADIAAAHAYLTARAPSRPAVAGLGAGGHLAAWAAARHEVTAAAAVISGAGDRAPWPGVPPLEALIAERRAPWLLLPGGADETWPDIANFLQSHLSPQ